MKNCEYCSIFNMNVEESFDKICICDMSFKKFKQCCINVMMIAWVERCKNKDAMIHLSNNVAYDNPLQYKEFTDLYCSIVASTESALAIHSILNQLDLLNDETDLHWYIINKKNDNFPA